MSKVQIIVLDPGRSNNFDWNDSIPLLIQSINSSKTTIEGIRKYLHTQLSFGVIAFIVNDEYFIAKIKTMYVGKNGQRSRNPQMGLRRIEEMSLKPIKHRRKKGSISSDITIYL